MSKYLYYLVIIIRLLIAPLIFIWPAPSVIVSFLLDVIDGDIAPRSVTKNQYQVIDKTLDFWVIVFEMVYAWIYLPDFRIFLLVLFLWRLIGMSIFYLTKKRKYFIVFADFFEIAFYVIFFKLILYDLNVSLILAFIIKLFQEWFIHVAELSIIEDLFGKKRKWKK